MKKYDIEENICSIGEQLLERIISPKRRYDILKIMLKTGFVKENLINEFIYLSREFGRDGEMLEYIWS